jgi:large subunit ribosomal protein L21
MRLSSFFCDKLWGVSGFYLSLQTQILPLMYAVVNIQGSQFKVVAGQKLYVNRMAAEAGSSVEFDQVMLLDNEGEVTVGKPYVEGATVSAKVLDHLKDDKVIVFHKKRRKGYQKKNGHRQHLSQIEIEAING